MKMNTTIYKMTGALGLLMYAGLASANAEAWSFGVMADTQATLSGTAYGTQQRSSRPLTSNSMLPG